MSTIRIIVLAPGMNELEVCARWRAETFSVLNASAADELASLQAFVAEPTDQVALMAMHDGQPAGTALLARSEIAPVHDVTPWLAGLYVAPAHRRHGVGAALVRAIEDQASSAATAGCFSTPRTRRATISGWDGASSIAPAGTAPTRC
ncbi:acetyltransferase [Rhodopseudomonas palustris]|nr:acetyltransferase [Rhodopseudomonas palustris]